MKPMEKHECEINETTSVIDECRNAMKSYAFSIVCFMGLYILRQLDRQILNITNSIPPESIIFDYNMLGSSKKST